MSRKYHGNSRGVSGGNHFLVADGASGLDDRGDAGEPALAQVGVEHRALDDPYRLRRRRAMALRLSRRALDEAAG